MKNKEFVAWRAFGIAGLLALAIPAHAQSTPATPTAGAAPKIEGAGKLLGNTVYGADNRVVGEIKDLVIDIESGRVLYAVVNSGNGEVAVAPQILGRPSGNRITAKVNKKKIVGAPRFTGAINQPGAIAKADFVNQVYQHFGQRPWWQGSAPPGEGSFHNVQKESDLIGMRVVSAQDQPLGTIGSMQVDLAAGRVLFLLLTPDSSVDPNSSDLFVLPPQAFTLGADQKHLVSGIDRQKLASAPKVALGDASKLNNPTFAAQVYEHYGKQPYFTRAP